MTNKIIKAAGRGTPQQPEGPTKARDEERFPIQWDESEGPGMEPEEFDRVFNIFKSRMTSRR